MYVPAFHRRGLLPFPDERHYLLAVPDNGIGEPDEEEFELPAETEIDTESEHGLINADDNDEDDDEQSRGDADYTPMVDSDELPVAEYGHDDFAVCRVPNFNLHLRTY